MLETLKNNDDWKPLKTYLISLEKNPPGGGVSAGAGEDHEPGGAVQSAKKGGGRGAKRKQHTEKEGPNKSLRLEAPED